MISNFQYFFMSLLAIYVSSLEKYPLKSFVHFLLLLVVSFRNSLYILDINPLSDMIYKYFLSFLGLILYCLNCIFLIKR